MYRLKWLFPGIWSKLNVRQPYIFQRHLLHVMFAVFGIEAQCIWTWMLFFKTAIIIILTTWNLEMKNAPAEFRGLPQKVWFFPFVLLMDLEIKLPLFCDFVFLGFSLCENSTQHPVSPAPSLGSGSASGFSRVKYWLVSGTLYAMEGRRDVYLQGAFLFIGARNKWVLSVYMSLSVSFFAKAAINIWILVRNGPFSVFTDSACHCSCGFHCVVKGILIFIIKKRNTVSEKCWSLRLWIYGSDSQLWTTHRPPRPTHIPGETWQWDLEKFLIMSWLGR